MTPPEFSLEPYRIAGPLAFRTAKIAAWPGIPGFAIPLRPIYEVIRILYEKKSGYLRDTDPGMDSWSKALEVERHSTIECPKCGHRRREEMPEDACVYFYECRECGGMLKPLPRDCCVFCSFGDVPCPPVQSGQGCS